MELKLESKYLFVVIAELCIYIEVMSGILTVVLVTDLRAECAVEVKYNRSKKSSPDCTGKALHF